MTMATTMTMTLFGELCCFEVEASMVGWFGTPQSVTLSVQGSMRSRFPTSGVMLQRLMMACVHPIAWGLYIAIIVFFTATSFPC
jgi:hypothetical protein